jgi:hypothetical protein
VDLFKVPDDFDGVRSDKDTWSIGNLQPNTPDARDLKRAKIVSGFDILAGLVFLVSFGDVNSTQLYYIMGGISGYGDLSWVSNDFGQSVCVHGGRGSQI